MKVTLQVVITAAGLLVLWLVNPHIATGVGLVLLGHVVGEHT